MVLKLVYGFIHVYNQIQLYTFFISAYRELSFENTLRKMYM